MAKHKPTELEQHDCEPDESWQEEGKHGEIVRVCEVCRDAKVPTIVHEVPKLTLSLATHLGEYDWGV